MHLSGLGGKDDKIRNGGKPKLGEDYVNFIDKCLDGSPADHGFEGENWYAWHVRVRLESKFGIDIAVRTLRKYLRKLASWYKPRPIPHQCASEEEQAKFIADAEQLMRELGDAWSLVFEDESGGGPIRARPIHNKDIWRKAGGNMQ